MSKHLIGSLAFAFILTYALEAHAIPTRKTEPGPGKLPYGAKVYVDDGSCGPGRIKLVTGGNNKLGIARKRKCVAKG